MAFATDEHGNSECQLFSAKSLALQARIKMPERVPDGFHSYFLPGERLER